MRIGFLTSNEVPNFNYRAALPAQALKAHGHQTDLVLWQQGHPIDVAPLRQCDVVHVYRRADAVIRSCADDLLRRGVALTWDNDDDVRLIPADAQKHLGVGKVGASRDFQAQAKMLRRADVATTTSKLLAERYRAAGASSVVVVPNYLGQPQYAEPARHDGLVIGWVAGLEHRSDSQALNITTVFRNVMERHQDVRVVTVGVRLALDSDRYEHHLSVQLGELRDLIRRFDIGIAPLADIPMSYARSDVKIKEYAACGVPWLASARGPYTGYGSAQGGALVPDDAWESMLSDLVDSRLKRFALRRRAATWGKTQMIDRHVDEWVSVFEAAMALAAGRRTGRGSPAFTVRSA